MKYRNKSGQITTRDRISIAGVANPTDETLAGIGWMPVVKFLEPEGATKIPGTQTWTETDGRWVEEWQVETDQEKADAETARIQAIADTPEAQGALTVLNNLLQVVGLSIPVTEAHTTQHILALMAAGTIPPDSGIAGNISGAWSVVLSLMGRGDVEAVWDAIKEASE